MGSSPRGRGKPGITSADGQTYRLIPARAGKTSERARDVALHEAHPRAGGENARSSRGRRESLRLIPARAGKTVGVGVRWGMRAAHPRAGGENLRLFDKFGGLHGSSPRGRGKRRRIPGRAAAARLIPARAGKTRSIMSRAASRQAHPRAGGENSSGMSWFWSLVGSSPRGRGKPGLPEWTFFPARAHPRAGGENGAAGAGWDCAAGSSPRGRGKPGDSERLPDRERLIPARAGKTKAPLGRCMTSPAHPRAGGENLRLFDKFGGLHGSSPRGRGKRRRIPGRAAAARLIPARAGKTRSIMSRAASRQAHPRAGGENSSGMSWFWSLVGSSPRGRGKPGLPEWTFFPARAHPRAGGENGAAGAGWDCAAGSSPRGRGKPGDSERLPDRERLIPARAGKTKAPLGRCMTSPAHPRAGGENTSV